MPLAAGPSPTKAQLLTLLRALLLGLLPSGAEVAEGQINRVPQPTGDNSVIMIPTGLRRLATTVVTWPFAATSDPPLTQMNYEEDVEVRVQLQIFGAGSFDNHNVITTVLRSPYAVDYFAGTGMAPLWCDDGHQIPFISGGEQYQDRWILEAFFQMSIQLALAQQFAISIAAEIIDVDAVFPPT